VSDKLLGFSCFENVLRVYIVVQALVKLGKQK